MDIKRDLISFLCKNFMVEEEEIDLDSSLIDQGVIDSFGLIEIATFIEQRFGIKIQQEQMVRENFGSVHKIVSFVERQL